MRVSPIIAPTAAAALTIAVSNPASAYTRAQCNAPYAGCLAKCGNRVTQSNANYQQLKSMLGFVRRGKDAMPVGSVRQGRTAWSLSAAARLTHPATLH